MGGNRDDSLDATRKSSAWHKKSNKQRHLAGRESSLFDLFMHLMIEIEIFMCLI